MNMVSVKRVILISIFVLLISPFRIAYSEVIEIPTFCFEIEKLDPLEPSHYDIRVRRACSTLLEKPDLSAGQILDLYNDLAIGFRGSTTNAQSLQWYDKALAVEGNFVEKKFNVLMNRGHAKYALSRYEDALTDYQDAQLFSDNKYFQRDALHNQGLAFRALGKHKDAITALSEAISLADNNSLNQSYSLIVRAHSYGQIGQKEKSLKDFSQAIEIKKSVRGKNWKGITPGTLRLRCYSYFAWGDNESAKIDCTQSIEKYQFHPEPHLVLAKIYKLEGNKESSNNHCEDGLHKSKNDPGFVKVRQQLIEFCEANE